MENKKLRENIVGAGKKSRRSENDYYPTPEEVTRCLLRFLDLPKRTIIWEPACGEMDMANTMQEAGYLVVATDIKYGNDFLKESMPACDWIITNPPFSAAEEFIMRCIKHGKPFALLLKSQFWHAKKRYKMFRETPPAYVCPLTWRPDFLFKEKKKSGAPLMDVMWCVWIPGEHDTRYIPIQKKGARDG